jgi:hypothetical protein
VEQRTKRREEKADEWAQWIAKGELQTSVQQVYSALILADLITGESG